MAAWRQRGQSGRDKDRPSMIAEAVDVEAL
jgi:hypothetical protein